MPAAHRRPRTRSIAALLLIACALILPSQVFASRTPAHETAAAPFAVANLDIQLATAVNTDLLIFGFEVLPTFGFFDMVITPDGPLPSGATVINHWDHLHYLPPTDFQGFDSFAFATEDGDSGVITVTVGTPPSPTPTPTPTPSPSPTSSPTPSATPTASPMPTATSTATPTPIPSATPTPTPQPGAEPMLSVSGSTWTPGTQLAVRIINMLAGASATFELHSDPVHLGVAQADSSGVIEASLALPNGVAAGAHTLVVEGRNTAGDAVTLEASITVVAAAVPDTSMPDDGGSQLFLLGMLALLASATGALVVATRKDLA